MKKFKLFKALMLLFSIMLISPQMWATSGTITAASSTDLGKGKTPRYVVEQTGVGRLMKDATGSSSWSVSSGKLTTGGSKFALQTYNAISSIVINGYGTGSSRTFSSMRVGTTTSNYAAASATGSGTMSSTESSQTITITPASNIAANSYVEITLSGNINIYSVELVYAGSTTKRIYMKCGSTWCNDNPKFYAHSWGSSENDVQLTLAPCETDVYYADIPSGNTSVIFTRQSQSSTGLVWSGSNFWNQSEDITIGANNKFTCTGWSNGKGTFSGGTYSAPTYTISFQGNGNTGGSTASHTGISCNGSQTLRANGFTRTGWTFTGWNTDKYGAGTAYAAGATINSITDNITLYAQWEKVIYLKMGSGWADANAWFAIYYYDSANDSKNDWVKMSLAENCSDPAVYKATVPGNGYNTLIFVRKNPANETLKTWDNKWNQTTNQSMPTSNNQFTVSGGSGDAYTGSWGTYSAPTLTISFNAGTGGSGTMTSISGITCDANQAVTANSFTAPSGYQFAGWVADVDVKVGGSTKTAGTVLADGVTIQNIHTDIALTAQWSLIPTYSVTYNANGGTGTTTGLSGKTEGFIFTAAANGFTNSGKVFKWWNTASNGSGVDYYPGEPDTIKTADQNLYAQWETVGDKEEFWVGNPFSWSTNTMTVGDMILTKSGDGVDLNGTLTKATASTEVNKQGGDMRHAKVIAVANDDAYLQVHFDDGSPINELKLGVCNKGGTKKMVVLYSTSSDFSSGEYEKVELNTSKYDQSTKAVVDFSPSTADKYLYARIYRQIKTAVYEQTGGSSNTIRIYTIKAKKGSLCEELDAPTGLSCTAENRNSLTFGWNTVSNASSYDVYLYSDEDCTAEVTPTEGKPYNVTGTSATLTGLDGGTTYYCKVRTKGNGSTYCTNGGITTTAANGKTKYVVTYAAGVTLTSGSVPTDANGYTSGADVTVLGNTGNMVYGSEIFLGWTDGTTFYVADNKFTIAANTTLTAVWSGSCSGGIRSTTDVAASGYTTYQEVGGSNVVFTSTPSLGFKYKDLDGNTINNSTDATTRNNAYSCQIKSSSSNRGAIKTNSSYSNVDSISFYFATDTKDYGEVAVWYSTDNFSKDSTNLMAKTALAKGHSNNEFYRKVLALPPAKKENNLTFKFRFTVNGTTGKIVYIDSLKVYTSSGSSTCFDVTFANMTGFSGESTLPGTIEGVPSGKKIVQPADPTAVGYTYGGWYADAACTSSFSFTSPGTITKDTTLYAKFTAPTTLIEQPAKIAGKRVPIDTLDAKNHPEIDSVIVHQLIDPTPYGTCNISYKLCYSNHVQLDVQPTIHYGTGAGVGYDTVWMPMEDIQMYELVAYLRTGATRGAGDLVTTDTALVSVEKTWPVKVRYIMDGVDLREPTEWPVYPSIRTTEVRIPKERNGYELDYLEYGVGVTSDSAKYINEGATYATYVKAANAATIIAHYRVPANTVYFFDTFEDPWYTPYIFDYGTTGYWDNGQGAGAAGHLGTHATRIDFMDRMYMMPIGASTTKLAIGSDEQKNPNGTGFDHFYTRTYTPEGWDHSITVTPEIFYRTDFNQALPMFVPVVKSTSDYYTENSAKARYFRGFWVKYSPDRDSTGYFLKVYDRVEVEGGKLIQSIPMRLTQTGEDGTWELTATMDLEAGKTYGFKYTKATGASTVDWYGNSGTMTSTNHIDWLFSTGTNNCGLTTTSAGDYTFHLHCVNYGDKDANTASATDVQGKMVMTVDYATLNGDFRIVYQDNSQLDLTDGVGVEPIASQSMRARANGQDTVTFYIRKDATGRSMKFQKFNAGAWEDVTGGTIALTNTADQTFTVSKDTTYQIYVQQNADGTSIEATGMDYYSGSYYIRTDCVDEHKWDYKQSLEAHRMVESDYATHLTTDPFTHYYVSWVGANGNVKYVVATQYSPTLTDTLITDAYANVAGGNLPAKGANVRFMYNKKTNTIKRAYLAGAQGGEWFANFLKLSESNDPTGYMQNTDGDAITSITFTDLGNFAYQASIKAKPGLKGKLTAEYNSQTQYFKGSAESSETILGGTGESWQNIVMTYDFKTNRLICAWTPGDTIDETMSINADVMIIRRGKNDAEQIIFKTNGTELQDVKYIYGVIQLDYSDLVGRMYSWDWWSYEHCMYYISFPFDVLVSDITGVGTIGQDWRIQRYNGALRAEKGWFEQDGVKTWWEDVHAGDTLHAYEGYSLLLARTRFNDSGNAIWKNKTYGDKVYLFFPSLNATTGIISNGEVTFTVPSHECKIERPFLNPYGEYVSHKISDSHWNMLGMPLFENKTAFSIAAGPTYETEYGDDKTLQYLYAWNSAGNTLGIQLTLDEDWEFKTMYSYMVQYTGEVTFKGSTVNKIVAAKRNTEKKNYYVKLELTKDEQFIGRTYVELRENAVDSFLLNEDICMVRNGVNADLYTIAGGYEAAANVLPIADQVVPVGIAVKKAGTYVFSMPSNFDGEVILVDTYHQTRTNLAIDDYEIALPTGEITDRFYLEININKVPTAIDGVSGGSMKDGKAHKYIENGQMYILQNGLIYDAQGKRVQ